MGRGTWVVLRRSSPAGRWKPAEEHALIEAVRRELMAIEVDEHTAAAMRGDNKAIDKARSLLSRSRAAAVARLVLGILAEDEPAFDAHADLLNTPSGVVDLRTGALMPADPFLYLTKMTGVAYDPDADMAMWKRACEALPAAVVDWMRSAVATRQIVERSVPTPAHTFQGVSSEPPSRARFVNTRRVECRLTGASTGPGSWSA